MRQNGVRSNVRFPYSKGKSAKKQGYAAREDESLGMRTGKESTKKQSFKDRRDESYGAWGKRKSGKVNKQEFIMGVVGAALRGFGKALRKHRIKHGGRGKTITSVKPMSGKVPLHIGAGGKDPGKRAEIVKTHFSVKRSGKLDAAEKKIKEGKAERQKMVDTGQAEELKGYKGKGTGTYIKKGFQR